MQVDACDVAVIGGGLAGASAALAFAQQGCSVRLFERRDLARDPNRGDILHPPTVQIARQFGILDLLDARGATRLRCIETVDPHGELAVNAHELDFRVLNHAEMEAAFLDAAESRGTTIQSDVVRSLVADGDLGNDWLLETDNGTSRARFVTGADGAHSLTRRTLGIPLADVHEYDHSLVVLHATSPAWLEPEHGWHLYPDGAVFIFPTTPVGRVRLILTVRREDTNEWMTSSEAELARRLGERHPLLQGLELTKRGGSHVYRLKRTHAARYAGPRAALAGDAAHTTHTMGGQGLNIAIQDSAQLAELVGPVLRDPGASGDALAQALVEYEAIRRPINTATLEQAHLASFTAGPGEKAYQLALDFFRRATADPGLLRQFNQGPGNAAAKGGTQ